MYALRIFGPPLVPPLGPFGHDTDVTCIEEPSDNPNSAGWSFPPMGGGLPKPEVSPGWQADRQSSPNRTANEKTLKGKERKKSPSSNLSSGRHDVWCDGYLHMLAAWDVTVEAHPDALGRESLARSHWHSSTSESRCRPTNPFISV